MTSLDPCLGLAFLIKCKNDLESAKAAFTPGTGPLSQLATWYDVQPPSLYWKQKEEEEAMMQSCLNGSLDSNGFVK
jgi:hypothetical protein